MVVDDGLEPIWNKDAFSHLADFLQSAPIQDVTHTMWYTN